MRSFAFLVLLMSPGIFGAKVGKFFGKCLDRDNPDDYLETSQIIRRHGYKSEAHTIVTEDNYILTLHRIPGPKNGTHGGQPIFLQHGLLSSSADWVVTAENSLAFMLADEGYDVWIGNARGNYYSKAHQDYTPGDPRYWNFSFHEMGVSDLPAALYHISEVTNKPGEIIYIGHSMGTTMFFVFSSLMQRMAADVKMMVAMAPVAYMSHIQSPIRYLTPFTKYFQRVTKDFGINQFLPKNKVFKLLAYFCDLLHVREEVCADIMFYPCGYDKYHFNTSLLPTILAHTPAGTSSRTVVHYAQEINQDGTFQRFDYGTSGNLIEYGTSKPPRYNLTDIKTPIYLMYADNDWLASPIDVEKLSSNIVNLIGKYKVSYNEFNHMDFIFGSNAPALVYEPLMQVLKKYRGRKSKCFRTQFVCDL